MSQPLDPQEKLVKYNSAELVEVLRRRLAQFRQDYKGLEQYIYSLEAEQKKLTQQLDELRQELRQWHNSPSVRLSRSLNLIGRNIQKNLLVTSGFLKNTFKQSIKVQLDAPQPSVLVTGDLLVAGWVSGDPPPNMTIEVWLDNMYLGLAGYPLDRLDVISTNPWQPRLDCGFTGQFSVELERFTASLATLKIRCMVGETLICEFVYPVKIDNSSLAVSHHQRLYQSWLRRTAMARWDFVAQRAISQGWPYRPRISLLLKLDLPSTTPYLLTEFIDSILAQTYSNWEIWLSLPAGASPQTKELLETYFLEDSRIHVADNSYVGLNELIEFAQGEYIGLPVANALLSQDAFFQAVKFLNEHQKEEVVLLYSDEDYIDQAGERSQPQFKPDWSPELFYSRPYIGQFTLYKTAAVKSAGGFGYNEEETAEVEAQAYNLTLRLVEKNQAGKIHHLPKIIYHRRYPFDLTKPLGGMIQKVLESYFERTHRVEKVERGRLQGSFHYRYKLPDPSNPPGISILIPTRDQSEVLRRCLDSILGQTVYPNYEIVVVDNASHQPETANYFAELSHNPKVKVLSFDGPFNYAAINNFAVSHAQGELLVFLNNDTEVISSDWLAEMASFAIRPDIGAVGARLLYPDNTIQHAGVVVGLVGVADHVLRGLPAEDPGYLGLAMTVKNVSALTAACMMTRRELFCNVGGFDEQNLSVAYNDVDYCLKLRDQGLRLVWTPYAELYHYESLSRGLDSSVEKESRLYQETLYMFGRWRDPISYDPYYNPNLSRDRLDYAVSERCSNP